MEGRELTKEELLEIIKNDITVLLTEDDIARLQELKNNQDLLQIIAEETKQGIYKICIDREDPDEQDDNPGQKYGEEGAQEKANEYSLKDIKDEIKAACGNQMIYKMTPLVVEGMYEMKNTDDGKEFWKDFEILAKVTDMSDPRSSINDFVKYFTGKTIGNFFGLAQK